MTDDPIRVLGVDLASRRWRDVGTAVLTLAPSGEWIAGVVPSAIEWPNKGPMTPTVLAGVIHDFVVANGIAAVSMDGPQGWRDPSAPPSQGVGRACERSAVTPGKTGCVGTTFPANQVGWISFSIGVFDHLLSSAQAQLASDPHLRALAPLPAGEYYVLECFPTVTWRSSGLVALPAKSRRPDTRAFAKKLGARWSLPDLPASIDHDDLQAIVAALVAASLFGVGSPVAHGTRAVDLAAAGGVSAHRAEGVIWDAQPPATPSSSTTDSFVQDLYQARGPDDGPAPASELVITTHQIAMLGPYVPNDHRRTVRIPDRGAAWLEAQLLGADGDVVDNRPLPPFAAKENHSPKLRQVGSPAVSTFDFQRAIPFIAAIPRGRWSSYKDVAAAAGNPKAFQSAGNQLRVSGGTIRNYWRVIHSNGSVADGFVSHAPALPNDPLSARRLLEREGVRFNHNGRADEAQHFYYEDWEHAAKPVSAAEAARISAAAEIPAVERDKGIVEQVNAGRSAKGKPPLTAAQEEEMLARLAAERAARRT